MTRPAVALLAALVLCVGLMGPPRVSAAPETRAMPFNDASVFNYFKNVEAREGEQVRPMTPEELTSRRCALFVKVMADAGYDFEATVKAAAVPTVSMGEKSRNPRYKFLAGVFQLHPKEFLARKLISQETYEAVMKVFEGQ